MNKKWQAIVSILKKSENYVPRDYQTIGGMWTADTYALNGYKLRIEDEGYTQVLLNDAATFLAYRNHKDEITFRHGSVEDFEAMAEHFGIK